ncbi:MAG TPA: HAD family hydrolase [Polyangiaceae bacterium]|nr:HAD family hydrolase [Polyangiaceae bacterium]
MNLALFDFDGTITDGDCFKPFLYFASPRRIILGNLLLAPLVAGYRAGWVSGTRLRAAGAYVGFRGRLEAELNEIGLRYAQTLHSRVRPEALDKIRWHQAQGDTVVVVSASLHFYLSGWCRELGVELICTELEASRGRLTGRYRGGDCTGREKARRVRERYELARYPVIYAYGDTPEDAELLALAHRRFFRWREQSGG